MGAAKGAPGRHARVGVGRVGVGRVGSARSAERRAEAVQIRHGHRVRPVCWRRGHAHRAHRQWRKATEALRDALLVARLLVEPGGQQDTSSVARTRIAVVRARTAVALPPARRDVGTWSAQPRYLDALALELLLDRLSAPVRRAIRPRHTLARPRRSGRRRSRTRTPCPVSDRQAAVAHDSGSIARASGSPMSSQAS